MKEGRQKDGTDTRVKKERTTEYRREKADKNIDKENMKRSKN